MTMQMCNQFNQTVAHSNKASWYSNINNQYTSDNAAWSNSQNYVYQTWLPLVG